MDIEKRKQFLINFSYWLIIAALIYVVLKYGLSYMMPFVAAFAIAWLLHVPIHLLVKYGRLGRPLAAVVVVVLFYGTIGVICFLAWLQVAAAIKQLLTYLPELYRTDIQPVLVDLFAFTEKSVSGLDPELLTALDEVSHNLIISLGETISGFSMNMIGVISGYASSLPGTLVRILFTVIATFFLSIDYGKVTRFLIIQLKEKQRKLVLEIKDYVIHTLFRCMLSYGLIMCITCLELSVGLTVIGVENPVMIAVLISVFDILPVLGTGGIMIPWTVITAATGDPGLALGLLLVYLFVTVVRNILEPKIVGGQVGLHPVVTLMALFVGARLFGLIGLFGLPIALSLIKYLNDKGTIHILNYEA